MTRYLVLFSCALALASSAVAQTKTSGSLDCDRADPIYTIQIPERTGFSYVIAQYKCTWTKPFVIEGLQSKNNVEVDFSEVMGTSVRVTGTAVTYYSNADRVHSRGTAILDQKAMTSSSKWTYLFGTGKLRGIKGGGTSTCKAKGAEPSTGFICDLEGEYTLPAAKK
jgi:hypothetical protein